MAKNFEKYRKNITNRERFVRIVEKRVNRIFDALESLGNCSNRKNYDYTDKDVKKIFDAIDVKIKEIQSLFGDDSKTKKGFTLE